MATEPVPCELCVPREVLVETALAYVRKDSNSLSRGHVLVVPRRHVASYFDMTTAEQVAVVAWDDDPMLAETLEPTLSANVLPAEQLGYEAAKRLDLLMRGQPSPTPATVIEPSGVLRVRQSSDVSTLEDRDVHLAMQYIREHGTEPLSVPKVAKVLGISRRKLEQHFARVTGHTPYDAIVRVRLDRAKQLLLETDWGLERVADRAGMGTAQTLRRLMTAEEGFTPREYRRRFSTT